MEIEPSPLNIFSSNRVELLYEELKENLFKKKTLPFARRTVVVPNGAMKNWLTLRMASDPDCNVAFGIEICYLDRALKRFYNKVKRLQSVHIINEEELFLLFESKIESLLSSENIESIQDLPIWKPLIKYLQNPYNEGDARLRSQRLTPLSLQLAKLFMQYGRYGCSMLASWEEALKPTCWQGELWKIIRQEHSNLYFPYQLLPRALEELESSDKSDDEFHLFALSFIPPEAHRFLGKAAHYFPIHYYLLSPCQLFWSDICSDREKTRIQRYWKNKGVSDSQQHALEDFLRKRNSILANFGRMGREMAIQIEDLLCTPHDNFQLPAIVQEIPHYCEELSPDIQYESSHEASLSLLQALHADMALLRNPSESAPLTLAPDDRSIQLHISYTKYREIENLYNTIVHLLTNQADTEEGITPADVIVMVPQLHSYEAIIEAIFGNDESCLDYQIMETAQLLKAPLVCGFLHLLELGNSRWEADTILELLDNLEFQRKQGFTLSELQQITTFVMQSGVHWGKSVAHREKLLKREHRSNSELVDNNPAGTWSYSLSRLVTSIAIEPSGLDTSQANFAPPIDGLEGSQSELIGRWVTLLKNLQEDLSPITNNLPMTLNGWKLFFEKLLTKYFQVDYSDRLALDSFKNFTTLLQKITSAAELVREDLYPFTTAYQLLKKYINEELSPYRESHLHAVRFCSLLPMRALPAKVVILLGMSEEIFPRCDVNFSLNELMSHSDTDYAPSQTDFDRYLFLEALLSARRYFILSYVGYSFEEKRQTAPSLLIDELFTYLDEGYKVGERSPSEACVYRHPFASYDKSYFQKKSLVPSYSNEKYRLAKSYYNTAKDKVNPFIREFTPRPLEPDKEEHLSLDIKELVAFVTNPLKFYFNKTLGIYLNKKDVKGISSEEPFSLTPLDKYDLRMKAIRSPIASILHMAEKSGRLPRGLLKDISCDNIQSDIDIMNESFTLNQVKAEEIASMSFTPHCDAPLKKSEGWELPPIHLTTPSGRKISLVGTLKEVTTQGIIFHQKCEMKSIAKIYPAYLLLQQAITLYNLPIDAKLISTKEVKSFKHLSNQVEIDLGAFVDYYFLGLHSPSPLIPEWIVYFLKEEASHLEKNMLTSLDGTFSTLYNEYVFWLFRDRSHLPSAEEVHSAWRPEALKLFGQLVDQF